MPNVDTWCVGISVLEEKKQVNLCKNYPVCVAGVLARHDFTDKASAGCFSARKLGHVICADGPCILAVPYVVGRGACGETDCWCRIEPMALWVCWQSQRNANALWPWRAFNS